ncbi:general transcription factor IIH subunit 3 isoform X2 [Halyomorpha halys]|uniref:general transcription factor IIH subunit 3 isoform X2 n=1 Tax=Halyomorpha halys TaxID=286706 RepID=UPI0006D4EA94|nr:general transcription factor IIH subunit 3 isoform X2 [Halyomorpha halys]
MAVYGGEERSLLVIVFDVHPCQKIITNHQHRFHQVLEAVIAFCNGHLLMKPDNKLAIIGCHSGSSDYIFSDKDYSVVPTGINDGQYELFAHVEKCIRKNIKQFLAKMPSNLPVGESLLAGACAMGLCYIQRMKRELPIGDKMNSRILVLTGSSDSASQYMNYMNVFFTAQKENVVIDVCTLEYDQGLLQQGCDITGGAYLKTPQQQGLLQYLMWVFLPEPPLRKKLVLPPPVKVDYRAACFCHRQLIDIGYVCSICLSIFCKFSPICTTCHALFKTPGPPPSKSKKKKPKM